MSNGGSFPDQAVHDRVRLLKYAVTLILLLPGNLSGLTLSLNDLVTLVGIKSGWIHFARTPDQSHFTDDISRSS